MRGDKCGIMGDRRGDFDNRTTEASRTQPRVARFNIIHKGEIIGHVDTNGKDAKSTL